MTKRNIVFWMAIILAGINLVGATPLLISLSAPPIANALGCSVPNFSIGPTQCSVLGIEVGLMLSNILGVGFYWFLTVYISAIAFGIWLAVLLFLLLTSRRRGIEARPIAIASDTRLAMTLLLAGITLIINLPMYGVFAIRLIKRTADCATSSVAGPNCIIFGLDSGPTLEATERFLQLIGENVNTLAPAIAGWALLALLLWLTFSLVRNAEGNYGDRRRIIFWMIAAFITVNLLAALPQLPALIRNLIIWSAGCTDFGPNIPAICLFLGADWQGILQSLNKLSSTLPLVAPAASYAVLIWLVVTLFLWKSYSHQETGNAERPLVRNMLLWMMLALAAISFLISFPSYASPYVYRIFGFEALFGLLAVGSVGRSALLIWIILAVFLCIHAKRKSPTAEI